jgi:hypothetical protein
MARSPKKKEFASSNRGDGQGGVPAGDTVMEEDFTEVDNGLAPKDTLVPYDLVDSSLGYFLSSLGMNGPGDSQNSEVQSVIESLDGEDPMSTLRTRYSIWRDAGNPNILTPWRYKSWYTARMVVEQGPKHSGGMVLEALKALQECVEDDHPRNRERINFPPFAFGMYMPNDRQFLDLVWQYAQRPTDARPAEHADQLGHRVIPNREAFFDGIAWPPYSQEKRRTAEDIVAVNVHHNAFMMRGAMHCLETCLKMEPPGRKGEIRIPFRAFGREIANGREWITLVWRYARIPSDTTWVKPVVDGGTESRTHLYNEYIRNLALLEAAQKGERALERAYLLRDPSDASRCLIPLFAFGHHIQDDSQWFNLVYRLGCLPDDMSFASTDALEE